MTVQSNNLIRSTLNVAFVAGLAIASIWVMRPFLLGLIWATTIVVATWPLLVAFEQWIGGKHARAFAATIMSLALLVIFLMPLGIAIAEVTTHFDEITGLVSSAATWQLPTAPHWLVALPLVGEKLASLWNDIAGNGYATLKPYANQAFSWATRNLSTVGSAFLQMTLTLVISAVLYVQGDAAALGVRRFFFRLAGDQGDRAVILAGQAVRGVALGVVVTAIAQSLLGGIGLLIVDVPFAGPLILLMFVFCLAQIGPMVVLLPIVGWMYWADNIGGAIVLLSITIVAGTMDNFLRPYLIKRGADLPLLLIFVGVIGGLVSFGPIGIFIGPVVLAVTFRLLEEWVSEGPPLNVDTVQITVSDDTPVGGGDTPSHPTENPIVAEVEPKP